MKETLYRVQFRSRRTGYEMFLLVWGTDAISVLKIMEPIVGPDSEYQLTGLNQQIENGNVIVREKK